MSHARQPSAHPRTAAEIALLPQRPEVVAAAAAFGVTEVLHFTRVTGAVGILASGAVKSRNQLPADTYLEHIYQPNAIDRSRDVEWHDYVNLSVSRINTWMFGTSQRWHARDGVPWVVFVFGPTILGDPGVVFTTTNNIYPTCHRWERLAGFTAMFDQVVYGRYASKHTRDGLLPHYPTDRQAEVLYPGALGLAHLIRIDVEVEETADTIMGTLGALGMEVAVRYAPEVFE